MLLYVCIRSRKEQKLHLTPWISKEIMNLIKEKNVIFIKCMKTNAENNWSEYKKKKRNKLTHIKESAKRQYCQNMIKENKNNTAKLWKTINDIIKLKRTNNDEIPNKIIASEKESAQGAKKSNLFYKYFTNIGVTLASKITKPNKLYCNIFNSKMLQVLLSSANCRRRVTITNKKFRFFQKFKIRRHTYKIYEIISYHHCTNIS